MVRGETRIAEGLAGVLRYISNARKKGSATSHAPLAEMSQVFSSEHRGMGDRPIPIPESSNKADPCLLGHFVRREAKFHLIANPLNAAFLQHGVVDVFPKLLLLGRVGPHQPEEFRHIECRYNRIGKKLLLHCFFVRHTHGLCQLVSPILVCLQDHVRSFRRRNILPFAPDDKKLRSCPVLQPGFQKSSVRLMGGGVAFPF